LALDDFGIQCVISSMIDDILYTHCVNAGVLPVVLEQSIVDELMADAMVPQKALMTIDLETQEIVRAGGQTVRFDVPSPIRSRLLQGADEIDMTVQNAAATESSRRKAKSRCLRFRDPCGRKRDATWNLR
jgi:3-isopropylmalate dehydratase small subunit